MVTMDSFPKPFASLNSYRNARITTTLSLLTSWTLHILYNISHWQLRILAPHLDFNSPKKLSLGATAPLPPPATTPLSKWNFFLNGVLKKWAPPISSYIQVPPPPPPPREPDLYMVVTITEHFCEDASKADFKAVHLSIANISCETERPILVIITMIWRLSRLALN